jgi:hypothetical protein
MSKMRTLIGQILILTLLISCREFKTVPTNPDADTPKNSGPSGISSSGVIVVRLVSFSEDEVNLGWADTDSTRTSYFVERKDADTSEYVVLAELSPWVKEYSDGGVKQILHSYYYRISAMKGASEKTNSEATQLYLNPRRPLSVRPIHISPDSVMLQWNFTGNISAGFLVQRSSNGIDYLTYGTTPRDQLTFTDSNLDTTQTYYYRAFTLTLYSMGPSSVPLRVGYSLNPMYGRFQWMVIP